MAVRAKNSGYEVYWRDPATGKQRGRVFKTKAQALKEDSRIKRLLRNNREALILESAGDLSEKCRIESVWARYKSHYEPTFSKNDRIAFRMFVTRCGHIDVRAFGTGDFLDIYDWLTGRGWKPSSVKKLFDYAKRILRFAVELGLIDEVPKTCKMPADKYAEFVPPTRDELKAMYEAACPRIRRVIILGAWFGMRVGPCEMFSMTWSDVDFDAWVIRLRAAKKNDKITVRTLPIPEAFRETFLGWKRQDGAIEHLISRGGKPVGSVGVGWKAMLARAGITRRIRPYDLRHAFATNLLEAGVDIGTVAKLMGHSTTHMITRHYQFVREERKMDALSRLDPLV